MLSEYLDGSCESLLLAFIATKSVKYHSYTISSTAQNTKVSPNFLLWKFCGKAEFLQKTVSQNPHTKKLGENSVFYEIVQYKDVFRILS